MSATFRDIAVSINGYQRDVAVFGVSGNPPTGDTGHEGIVKYLVRSRKFDEVWVLPVFRHQFSSKRDLAPFAKRVHLCQIAFESYSSETCKVRVLTVEEDVEASVRKHGTIDTIHFLKKYCPDAHFHLILGSDTYSDIIMGKWKHGERLFDVATLHVIERFDHHIGQSRLKHTYTNQVQIHKVSWLADTSSTHVRNVSPWPLWPFCKSIGSPFLGNRNNLSPRVYQNIKENKLFFFSNRYIKSMMRCRLTCLSFLFVSLINYIIRTKPTP